MPSHEQTGDAESWRVTNHFRAGRLRLVGTSAPLADPDTFDALRRRLYDAEWVVYAKRPFGGPEQVIRYLSRYTHRVAISSSRLLSVDSNAIVFTTHAPHTCRLEPREFLRRFLLHVLPHGFRKIRHYGLLAPSNVTTRLPIAQRLARAMDRRRRRAQPDEPAPTPGLPRPHPPRAGDRCPVCAVGLLVKQPLPMARAPPRSP